MIREILRKIWYGPSQWYIATFPADDRLAFASWTFILSAIFAPFLGNFVWYVTILSVLAIQSNVSAETPVKKED